MNHEQQKTIYMHIVFHIHVWSRVCYLEIIVTARGNLPWNIDKYQIIMMRAVPVHVYVHEKVGVLCCFTLLFV